MKLKRDEELMASALAAESSGNSDDDYEDPGYIKPNFYPDLKPHLVRCSSDSSAHPRSKMRKFDSFIHTFIYSSFLTFSYSFIHSFVGYFILS